MRHVREYFDIVTHQRTGERYVRWVCATDASEDLRYSRIRPDCRNTRKVLDAVSRDPYVRTWFRTYDEAAYQGEL